jgi:HD-like signal output (HDOD) protein
MSPIVIALVLLAAVVALAVAWLLRRNRSAARPNPAAVVRPLRVALPVAPASSSARPPAPAAPNSPAPPAPHATPPAVLADANWTLATTLDDAPRQTLVDAVGRIRRPPATLHQMLSPQFLDRASSQSLSDLINGEAQLAAKVLATVNAPLYGLTRPVSSIGQAVTFLGLNTVRSIVLRDMLESSFPAKQPALRKATQDLWNASALASELCNRLSGKLGLADSGALVAQVLLSFLGHLATATLVAERQGNAPPTAGSLLHRTSTAQEALGLGPAEIGGLLLKAWGLPNAIVDRVRAIDRIAIAPSGSMPATDAAQLALAHLCARLGEQLAADDIAPGVSLAGLAAGMLEAEEGFHLHAHLAGPTVARLIEHLQAPDLVMAMQGMQRGLRATR